MTAQTPGRAAYEEYIAALGWITAARWHDADDTYRAAWEAAAQAAIAAVQVPSLIVKFDGEVTEERAAEIRQALDAAVKGLVSQPVPELAEAMRESRQYRELLTEILATFGTPAKPGTVRWTAKQVAGWRKRAGLETR